MSGKRSEQHDQAEACNSKLGMGYTKDIAHELNELYRYSNLKKAHPRKTSLEAHPRKTNPNQKPSDQSICLLPAPARFTRKTKKPTLDVSRVKLNSSASPAQSCETSATRFVDSYDAILQRLMYSSGDDDFSLDLLVIESLASGLNVEQ
jgi:hypothetical protein